MADLKKRIIAVFSAQNKAKGTMASFRRGLDMTGRAMKRMAKAGAVMTMAAVAGSAYMIKRQMEAIDVIAKLSDRLGIATEDLVGLQHAASISGVSTEALNKSLDMFVRRLGEMTMGSGEAQRGLEMLGLTTEELIRLSPAEAMGIAADKINRLETQAEKAAAAYFLFGRAGAQLVTMFAVGSEGLREFQREAERLGLTFTRFDAAQIEAANDALTRARAAMIGLTRTATIELAPYIEAAATAFVDFATAGEGMGANVVNAFESISLSIVTTAEEVERLIQKFAALTSPLEHAKKLTKGTEAAWKRYRQETGETRAGRYAFGLLRPPVQPRKKELFESILAEERVKAGVGVLSQESRIRAAFENIRKKAAGETPKTIKEQRDDAIRAKMAMIDKEVAANQKRIDFLKQTEGFYLEAITEAHHEAAKEIDEVWREMENERAEREWHAMRAPIIEAEKLAAESAERNERIAAESAERRKRIAEDIALSMAGSWSDAIDQMMFENKKFWDAMTDMARSLVREIAKIIIYKQFAEPMAYAIMGQPVPGAGGGPSFASALLSGLTGGLLGAGAAAGAGTDAAAASAFSSPHGGQAFPSGQHGGDVLRTGLAVIHRGETFSGVNGNYGRSVINVNNTVSDRVNVEIDEYMQSDQRIIDVTMRAAETDGPYRRSIRGVS